MSHKILSWKCFGKHHATFGSLTFINELTLFKSNFLYFGTINCNCLYFGTVCILVPLTLLLTVKCQNDLHTRTTCINETYHHQKPIIIRNLSSSALHKTSLHPNDDNLLQPISCLMTSSWRMTEGWQVLEGWQILATNSMMSLIEDLLRGG